MQLGACGLYDDLWQIVYDWFREFIISTVTTKLEEAAQEMLPALMESFTQDMLVDGFEIMGMRFDVAPELLDDSFGRHDPPSRRQRNAARTSG